MAAPAQSPDTQKREKNGGRVSIINAVKDPLGFSVLVVLVIELTLGGLAAKGPYPLVALYGMFFFLAVMIAFVGYLAVFRSAALRGGVETEEGTFSKQLAGYWWEIVTSEQEATVSWIEISPDPSTQTIHLNGRMYGINGELSAQWDSQASCIKLSDRKVFYYWQGRYIARPNQTYEGLGEIKFYDSGNDASGHFSDTNFSDLRSATLKSSKFTRSSAQEAKVLRSGDDKLILALVKEKLSSTH